MGALTGPTPGQLWGGSLCTSQMTGSSRSLSDPAVHPLPLSGPCRAQVQTHRLAFLIPPSTLSVGVSRPYPNSDQSRSPWGQPPRSPSPASGPGALGLLGRGQAVQTCPELLVTSYLLLWGRECCRAGQREVTPPMFGCVWVCPRGGGTGLWPWGSSRNPARLPPGLHLPPSLGEPSLSPEGPGQGGCKEFARICPSAPVICAQGSLLHCPGAAAARTGAYSSQYPAWLLAQTRCSTNIC